MSDYTKALRGQVDAVMAATRTQRDQMRKWRNLFEGKLWKLDEPEFQGFDRSTIQFNILFSTIETIVPILTDNRPIAQVNPKYPFLQKLGQVFNNIAKYFWQSSEMQLKLHKALLDAKTCQLGIIKCAYNAEKRWGSKYDAIVIDPINFFCAPGYEDNWEAPWQGVRCMKPLSWVHSNFPDVKEIKGTTTVTGETQERAFKFSGAEPHEMDTRFVEVTEVWVRDDAALEEIMTEDEEGKRTKTKKYPYGKFCWFTPNELLGEEAIQDNHGLPPYVLFWNYVRPHSMNGFSDVEVLEGLHKDLNWLLKNYSEYIHRYMIGNELVDIGIPGGFDVDTYKATRAKGGQVYTYNSGGANYKPPVSKIEEPEWNAEGHRFLSILPAMAEEVSGVTAILKGRVGKSERQPATETALLNENSNARPRQQIRNLESSVARVYYLLLRLVQQYQRDPEYFSWQEADGRGYQNYGNSFAQAQAIMEPKKPARMERMEAEGKQPVRPEDEQMFQRYKEEYEDYLKFLELFRERDGDVDPILVDFDIEVQADSMLPKDMQSRANSLIRLMQMAPPPAQPAMFELVLEQLQIPDAQKVIEAMKQPQAGPNDQKLAQQFPEKFQQYQREVANG